MKSIEYNLPDINFKINVSDSCFEKVKELLDECMISSKKNSERYIIIDYIIDEKQYFNIKEKMEKGKKIIYHYFKERKAIKVKIDKVNYYTSNSWEYVGIQMSETKYRMYVKEDNIYSRKWIIRIIREIYLREKEEIGFNFMHGTGVEIDKKGILLLGNSGSGKTTLAIKLLELGKRIKLMSNDRTFLNIDRTMDYYPFGVSYAIGTVKNNKLLDEYFKKTRILEKNKNVKYEEASYQQKCMTPLIDITKVFPEVKIQTSTTLNLIIFPTFEINRTKVECTSISNEEKKQLLEQTDFTPVDPETLRIPWIRERKITDERLIENKKILIDEIIKCVKIKRLKYGALSEVDEILKILEESENE